ncbi:MAG: FumA C-terminus/TtdB family hydratase beta subunit [Phycisphaerae bacterium]|nr:FumA C-terminus/TtdB family hydratase beta subunit [Phycisphaerae bacterium]
MALLRTRARDVVLEEPFTAEAVRGLSVGDVVRISGTVFTARDAVHKYLFEGGRPPVSLKNSIIYHCGPVMIKQRNVPFRRSFGGGGWAVKAAGPTTSAREEPYMPRLIERFGIRAIIGKGGMGPGTLEACAKFGCVYLSAVGGAAQVLAASIKEVKNVYMLEEFGSAEAIWEFRVEDFPTIVTMDTRGRSLHAEVLADSEKRRLTLERSK